MVTEFRPGRLAGVGLVVPAVHRDARGTFAETYDVAMFHDLGIREHWVQDSVSSSTRAGTVRGLHFQHPPDAQAKLVRVQRGRVWDVVVDLRSDSPTYGQHEAVDLVAGTVSLYIPVGFAHGFVTLVDDTEIVYKMSSRYSPESADGIPWDDRSLGIQWPVEPGSAILSERDLGWPPFERFESPFRMATK